METMNQWSLEKSLWDIPDLQQEREVLRNLYNQSPAFLDPVG
jgi:hypothetical protein